MCGTDVSPDDVIFVLLKVSGQTKITDLQQLPLTDQDVPGCQVSVDTLRDTQHLDNMSGSKTVLETSGPRCPRWDSGGSLLLLQTVSSKFLNRTLSDEVNFDL